MQANINIVAYFIYANACEYKTNKNNSHTRKLLVKIEKEKCCISY